MKRKYDIWLPLSYGMGFTLNSGTDILKSLIDMIGYGADMLINGLHRVGCAYRVQFESNEKTAADVKTYILDKLDYEVEMEESRGFSAS